jgi:hypothetical protein
VASACGRNCGVDIPAPRRTFRDGERVDADDNERAVSARGRADGERTWCGRRTAAHHPEATNSGASSGGDERRRFILVSSAMAWLRFFYGGENYREMLEAVLCGDGPCGWSLHEWAK